MDMIPKTAEEIIRAGLKTMGSDQAEKPAVDFSRILARHVGQNGNPKTEPETRYPERANREKESLSNDSMRTETAHRAEHSGDSSGKPATAEGKNDVGIGAVSANQLDGEMVSGLQLPSGMGATTFELGFGSSSPLGLSGPGAPTVTLVGLSSNLAGEIAARYSAQGGVQTLTMRLDPAHLGKVAVTMVAKGNHLTVRLDTGNQEAETALRENLKDLTDAIGAKTGRFNQIEVKVQVKAEGGTGGRDESEYPEQQDGRHDSRNNPDGQDSRPEDHHSNQALNDPMESGIRTQGG